jgi:pimeloyl-ACP methyl ester carboxylesterase
VLSDHDNLRRVLMAIDRRWFLKATSVLGTLLSNVGSFNLARASQLGLLDPARVEGFPLPEKKSAVIEGGAGKVSFTRDGEGPLILYFHGWGDDYRGVMPLECGLTDAGFRVLLAHRPGYQGSTLEGTSQGKTRSWEGPAATADLFAKLLDTLYGTGKWTVAVVSMSGGTPSALAFASRYPAQTRAVVLQAGVTQPFTEAKYVPEPFRQQYEIAFNKFGFVGDELSKVLFALLVKLRETFLTDEDTVEALTGGRLAEAKQDNAFKAVSAKMLFDDGSNRNGEWSDVRHTFFAKGSYCDWGKITAPTLLIHDEKDTFVPIVHAEEAWRKIRNAKLQTFALGGHMIWLGRDARQMHDARVEFLKLHT